MRALVLIFLSLALHAQAATTFLFTRQVDNNSPTFVRVPVANSSLYGLDGSGSVVMVANSTFAAASHSHTIGNVSGLQTALDGKPDIAGSYANPSWITSLAYAKLTGAPSLVSAFTNDAGYLTSSALTPYLTSATAASTYYPLSGNPSGYLTSSALTPYLTTSAAASTYAPINNPTFTGTVGGITKSMVGLGNVDNTSDANKPISTLTQTALNGKASLGATQTFAAGFTNTFQGEIVVDDTIDFTDNAVFGFTAAAKGAFRAATDLVPGTNIQAYHANTASWSGVTRASGFDNFAATASSANLRSLMTDKLGTGALLFDGATPTGLVLTNATSIPAGQLTGTVSVNRFNSGTGASSSTYLRGDGTWVGIPVSYGGAASDETTALTSGTNKLTYRIPHGMTITGVFASLTTAQTSGSIFTVDINVSGSSILSTKLTIDNTEKGSDTAATAAVISSGTYTAYSELTFDIDQVGDGTAKGLKIWISGTR